ncbi:MAG: BatA domain-containing protein [Cyclobacteriaceae bacterium]|nr:BatA domain-containing protein [Cyclobacteriaceae bacterium]
MSFVYPAFLWALTALSIPVIIHLFNFRKTQKIYFSSTRFLRQVQEATSAKRKLKHYLILASRLLFLLFLILAFAQPFLPATEQVGARQNIVIYLDNSLSMSVPVGEKTRALDDGIAMANQIVDIFPQETRFQLLTNDFAPFSNTYKTKAEVVDLLAQIRLSPITRTFKEVKDRIDNTNRTLTQDEIFWISDFQQSTTGALSSSMLDSAQRLHLIPLTFEPLANIFVDTAYLENPFVVGGEKNTLTVKLRNDGAKAIDQLLVKLTVNGIQTGTSSVSIAAQGSASTSFDIVSSNRGNSKAVISFNDYPVSFDNEFYLAFNFSEKVKVVEIKSTGGKSPVEKVYGNAEVFTFRSFDSKNVNYSTLQETDLIVINSLDIIDAALVSALRNYVMSGGALLVIPSASPDVVSYKNLLSIPSLTSVSEPQLSELENPDFTNPFFENVFEERSNRLVLPKARRVMDWGNDRLAVLKFKNEKPFLSQFNQGGKIFLLAAPLQPEFSDLSNNFLFLPVMYRIATSAKRADWKPYYSLNETLVTLRADSLSGEQQVRLVGQQEIIPFQRKLTDRVILELPRFSMQAGFYHAAVARDTVGLFAFNLNSSESLLRQWTGEEVKEQLGGSDNIALFEATSAEAFSNEIKARYLGKPLWKYALVLALIFLLVEILLIRFLK